MARRSREAQDGFAHSPFKTLKGLPVSGEQRPPAAPPVPAPPVPANDDGELFTREMDWLAVRPLPGKRMAAPSRNPAVDPKVADPAADEEATEFLTAIGQLDKTFKDELTEFAELPQARPRRMRQLERGELQPTGTLDLHGLSRDEALARTRVFLMHASRQGWAAVLIVTGKGLHSSEGPVLRRTVENLLHEARDLVLEWAEAPRRHGGAGALVVFMRQASPPA